jgi:hypothetical protein
MAATTGAEDASAKRGSSRGAGNAFCRGFLAGLDERTEPYSAAEADYDGPWTVRPCARQGADGYGVFRHHERPPDDPPEAWFRRREHALLAAAVLPSVGRDPHYRVATKAEPEGFAVRQGAEPLGYFTDFNEMLGQAMHVGECLVRSPVALASLLLAASTNALRLAGRILVARRPVEVPEEGADGA